MRRALELAAIAVLSVCAHGTQAEPYAYITTLDPDEAQESYRLIQVDLATGASTVAGRIGYFDVEGLAISPDGTLYGVSDVGANKTLMTIDTSFGRGTAVGGVNGNLGPSVPTSPMDFGLAFSCDGRLWMSSDTTGNFWEVDRNTGRARLVGNLGFKISGLAGAADALYGVGIEQDRGLFRINLDTGTATRVGSPGAIAPYVDAGMDVDSAGNLWAVLDYNRPPDSRPGDLNRQSDLVRIDARTGAFTYVSRTFPEAEGMAIGRPPTCATGGPPPAPPAIPLVSPAGLLALAALMLGVGIIGLRRL
jgi:hypothetical protein